MKKRYLSFIPVAKIKASWLLRSKSGSKALETCRRSLDGKTIVFIAEIEDGPVSQAMVSEIVAAGFPVYTEVEGLKIILQNKSLWEPEREPLGLPRAELESIASAIAAPAYPEDERQRWNWSVVVGIAGAAGAAAALTHYWGMW